MASFSDLWTFESPLVLFQDLRIVHVYVVFNDLHIFFCGGLRMTETKIQMGSIDGWAQLAMHTVKEV